jgi:SAM-dependent methyltransferase
MDHLRYLYSDSQPISQMCRQLAADFPPLNESILYEISAKYITNDMQVLDVGCHNTEKTRRLVQLTGSCVLGFDIIRERFKDAPVHKNIALLQADACHIPVRTNTIDAIWCIDMLSHIERVDLCFAEFARVLKPAGKIIIYSMECSHDMPVPEYTYLAKHLALAQSFADPQRIHRVASNMNLHLRDQVYIDAQWRESWEYSASPVVSSQLLRIAQMRRFRQQLVDAHGEALYHAEYARCMANIWHMMGFFQPVIWVYET